MIPTLHLLLFSANAQLKCLAANGGASDGSPVTTNGVVTTECDTGLPTAGASGSQLHAFLQITLGIFAVITVVMIIISALNILYGEGDPQKLARARSSIIYALVGLVITVSAEIIVTFIVGRF